MSLIKEENMIKDILVNLSTQTDRDAACDYAISVAREFEAHLTGVAFDYVAGIPGTIFDGGVASVIAAYRAENRRVAQLAKEKFENVAKEAGVLADAHILTAGVAVQAPPSAIPRAITIFQSSVRLGRTARQWKN